MPPIRTPRFGRPAKPHNVRISSRDFHIISRVFRYRLLDSRHIAVLAGGSPQNLLRRLKLLYNNRYLDRPLSQLEYYRSGGSPPIIYALGNRGADLLQAKLGIPRKEIDWTAKNHSIKRLFLHHTLAISEILVNLESACGRSDNVEFVGKEEAWKHLTKNSQLPDQPEWRVRVPFEKSCVQVGVIPDYLFGLRRIDERMNIETTYFFLEVDRGTMPVMRKNLKQTSVYRKLLAYHETWKQELHASLFGLKRFRILMIANGRERLEHIISAGKLLNGGKGSGIFLFGTLPDIRSCNDILKLPFADGHGNSISSLIKDITL